MTEHCPHPRSRYRFCRRNAVSDPPGFQSTLFIQYFVGVITRSRTSPQFPRRGFSYVEGTAEALSTGTFPRETWRSYPSAGNVPGWLRKLCFSKAVLVVMTWLKTRINHKSPAWDRHPSQKHKNYWLNLQEGHWYKPEITITPNLWYWSGKDLTHRRFPWIYRSAVLYHYIKLNYN